MKAMLLGKRIICFILSVLVVICMIPASTTHAYADDQSQYITELSVTPVSVQANGKAKVEVSFSDGSPDEHVFHGGDTIEISWPTSGDAFLKGYKTNIPLVSPDGVTYGNVSVTAQGAVITFNDAVNEMYDVSGNFFFEVLAKNDTDTTEEDTKTVTITSGSKTADLSITKPASGGTGTGGMPDFRKQAANIGGGWTTVEGIDGWVMTLDPDDPTYTSWILSANEKKESASAAIKIKDSLGQGQKIDTSWAHLYTIGDQQKDYSGTLNDVIEGFVGDYPESGIIFDEAGNIEWVLDKTAADKTSWYFEYRCDITDFSLLTFENNADIYWEGEDGVTHSAHSGSQFANVDQGGGAIGLPRGVLKVIKKVKGTDLFVQGVEFRLEKSEGSTWTDLGSMVTDEKGEAVKSKLKTGHYRLYEVRVPAYLEKEYTEDAPFEFDIDVDDPEIQSLELVVEDPVVTTDITATKRWENADGSPDESVHPTVYFKLYRSVPNDTAESVGDIKPLENGVLNVTWTNLPQYDAKGNEYSYTVKEVDTEGNDFTVEGYSKEESGLTVINTKNKIVETVDIKGEKIWDDNDDQDGVRPDSITIGLFADSDRINELNVTAENNWSWCFENLPKQGTNGNDIEYSVKEDPVSNYETTYEGDDIKNTHKPETTTVKGEKVWDFDESELDKWEGFEYPSIKINLMADGVIVASKILNESTGWEYVFSDLPKYRDHGIEIKYTINETTADGKDIETDGFVDSYSEDGITNTPIVREKKNPVELTIKKVDADSGAAPEEKGLRGAVFTLSGEALKESKDYTTDKDGLVKITFTEDGEYILKETKAPRGYVENNTEYRIVVEKDRIEARLETEENQTFWEKIYNLFFRQTLPEFDAGKNLLTIENSSKKLQFSFNKIWDDNDDQDGIRPENITVTLTGKVGDVVAYSDTQTFILGNDGPTAFVWPEIPLCYDGREISYRIEEKDVEGYDIIYKDVNVRRDDADNTIAYFTNIVNKHEPEKTSVSGKKTWDDNEDQDGVRPESITVRLLADGSEIDTKTVTGDDGWSWTFSDLPKYRDHGTEIVYTVTEDAVEDYTTSYDGNVIINTHTPGKTSISVVKAWDDNDDRDGIRPKEVEIELVRNGEDTGNVIVLRAENNWTSSFTDLDQYSNGTPIQYTIKENLNKGYTYTTEGDSAKGYVITNHHIPEKTEKPEKPSKPEKPEKPSKPEKPEEIKKPEKPEEIKKPEKPEEIKKPEKPEEIKKSEKPERPKEPDKSHTPETGDNTNIVIWLLLLIISSLVVFKIIKNND